MVADRRTDLARRIAEEHAGAYVVSEGPYTMTVQVEADAVLHVALSHRDRYPTWAEIKAARALLWDPEAEAIQIMPLAPQAVDGAFTFDLYGDLHGRRRWRLQAGLLLLPGVDHMKPIARHLRLLPPRQVLVSQKGERTFMAGIEPPDSNLHLSYSLASRYPTWSELMALRRQFWPDEAQVVQFLPPASEYVNIHENCFHLYGDPQGLRTWRLSSLMEVSGGG